MDRSCQPGAAALARMRLPGRRDHAAGGRLLVVPCGLGPWSAPAGASSSSEKKPGGPTRPRRAPIRPSQRGQNPARAGSTQRRRLAFPARALRLSPAPDCSPIALNSRISPPRTRAAIRRPAGRRSHRADRGRLALRQKQGAPPAGNHGSRRGGGIALPALAFEPDASARVPVRGAPAADDLREHGSISSR
jgi:hypothetical protein